MRKRTVKLAPGEEHRLRASIVMAIYDVAQRDGLTGAQFRDIVDRLTQSADVFLTEDNRLEGVPADILYGDLKDDPKNAHLFAPVNAEKPQGDTQFGGMSKEQFDKLPARQRLQIANEAAANKPH